MERRHRLWAAGLIVSVLMTALPSIPAAAAGTRFGAKLTRETQPTERQWCRDSNHSATCTWVAVEAYANGDRYKAPRDGTIRKVRLISCVGGTFRVQVARARRSAEEARIVRQGPTITYVKDSQPGGCGGDNFDNYRIQTFSVNFRVNKGDYIAAKGTKIGFMNNSSSGPSLKFRPPLPVGGSYQEADDSTGSLLLQFEYAS